jgi:putative ABC transport system ATP-binding protein
VVALLHELNADGVTIVVITHDERIAGAMRRRVEIQDGVIVGDTGVGDTGVGDTGVDR